MTEEKIPAWCDKDWSDWDEADWQACVHPIRMMELLLGTHERVQDLDSFPDCRFSDRKLRLFASACGRRVLHLLSDPLIHEAVEVAERWAEGEASTEEAERLHAQIHRIRDPLEGRWRASRGAERAALAPTCEGLSLAGVMLWREPQKAAYYAPGNAAHTFAGLSNPVDADYHGVFLPSEAAEERAQANLLRCIFGNPFRPVAADPRWFTAEVVALARAIYEERAFDRLSALADALRDAGCDDESMLAHCQSEGGHARGCWVVDRVLGKT